MLVDDLLGIGLYLGYFVVAGLPILLLKTRINLHSELTRKMPHFVLIFSIFPVMHFFSAWYMSILASVVLVLLAYPLLMLAERSTWYKNFAAERDGGEFKSSLIVVQLAQSHLGGIRGQLQISRRHFSRVSWLQIRKDNLVTMNTALTKTKPIPGPKLLEAVRGLRQEDFLYYVGQLWQTYGDTFQLRLGLRTLTFAIHPESVRHIAISNRKNYDKLGSYDGVRRYLTGEGLVTSTGDTWRRQRKLMSPFFTPRAVTSYADIMLRDGAQLLRRWEDLAQQGQTIEMGDEMTLVTASIILKAMFSTETSEDIVEMKDAVETMVAFTNEKQTKIDFPQWVPTRSNREYRAASEKAHGYITDVIAQREAMPVERWPDDLLTRLMQARDEETGQGMTGSLLIDESITTFFAGHETTARTMSATWYALGANPDVASRLHEELDGVLGDRYPTLEDLHDLPYTLQVIKEVLRLYPPAPFYVRDAIGGDTLDGYKIPAGSAVMLSPYYTHRHPDFWENPLQFDPDRWTPEREADRHPYAYHPFAAGQRVCIGNSFSLLESHILLALLAKRFQPRLLPGYEPEWTMRGVLSTANGLPMVIEAR